MDTLDTEQKVDLQRKEVNGEHIYFDSQGNYFDQRGLLVDKAKFESLFGKAQQIKTTNTDKEKRTKKKLLNLRRKKLKIAVAESCTGGMLSSAITSVSGSSIVFTMGLITYSNKSKNKLGYKPLVSINEGIPLFIDWYKSYYL